MEMLQCSQQGWLWSGRQARFFMGATAPLIAEFEGQCPFQLDTFQKEAIAKLAEGRSVLVAAPTGTGKTVVAEFGVFCAWKAGRRSIYTTPIKALSNQKFRDFRAVYGDVGLMTGDIVENPTGRIVVMTTEVLRNILVQAPWELSQVSVVVFDEIHYLSDPERGTVWEEAILLLPKDIQIVALSATVSNAEEIRQWMEAVHGPTDLVYHAERAVPLEHRYMFDGKVVTFMDAAGRQLVDLGDIGGELRRRGEKRGKPRAEPTPSDVLAYLRRENLLPAIYFLFRRRDAEVAAESCEGFALAKGASRRRIENRIRELLENLSPEDRRLNQVQLLTRLLRRGVAFHHAGLLPVLKVMVEELFNEGHIGIVFATDTLALGINMPARTVVIGSFTKFDGEVTRLLTPNEYQQMTGRAGRRGKDQMGVALIPYSPWVSFKEILQVVKGELLPVQSSFSIRYNSLVNLWSQDLDHLSDLFGRSLASFQLDSEIRQLVSQLDSLRALRQDLAKGCLIGLEDRPLDVYEGLRRDINQLRKDLARWQMRLKQLLANAQLPAWPVPSREEVKAAVTRFSGGEIVHLKGWGWAVYRGRQGEEIGTFETIDSSTVRVARYDQIDYIPEPPVALPDGATLREALPMLGLPDLEALQAEFRAGYEPEIHRLEGLLASLEEKIASKHAQLVASPCHRCELLQTHRRQLRQAEFVELQIRRTEAELEEAQDRRRHEVRTTLQRMVRTLEDLGHVERGKLTEKAAMLANIFHPSGLIIVELLWAGHLDKLAPAEVAEVISWFAYDRDTVFTNRLLLPNHLWRLRSRVAEIESYVVRTEARNRLRLTPGIQGNFQGLAYFWAMGVGFDELLSKVALSEGDVISTFNKTIDLLNQILDMLRKVSPDHVLTYTVPQAISLMRRGIVEQCYILATPAGDQLSGAVELP